MPARAMEVVPQLRPRALKRRFLHPDLELRDAMRWYYRIGARVWPYEIKRFVFERTRPGPTLEEFWGAPQAAEEESMRVAPRSRALQSA